MAKTRLDVLVERRQAAYDAAWNTPERSELIASIAERTDEVIVPALRSAPTWPGDDGVVVLGETGEQAVRLKTHVLVLGLQIGIQLDDDWRTHMEALKRTSTETLLATSKALDALLAVEPEPVVVEPVVVEPIPEVTPAVEPEPEPAPEVAVGPIPEVAPTPEAVVPPAGEPPTSA